MVFPTLDLLGNKMRVTCTKCKQVFQHEDTIFGIVRGVPVIYCDKCFDEDNRHY